MRIISGQWKGKPLIRPEGRDIRPTSDRTREALFNLLMHMPDDPVTGQRIIDLCCGSGALGLEALSRGAAHGSFVDNAADSLRLTQANIAQLGATHVTQTYQANASQLPLAPAPVSLVLMDPPYRHASLVQSAFASLQRQGWLAAGTILAIEQSAKMPEIALTGCEQITYRKYGKSTVSLFRYDG